MPQWNRTRAPSGIKKEPRKNQMSKARTEEENLYIENRIRDLRGQTVRRRLFESGERRDTFEQILEKYGVCERMCVNCAFRPGSVEDIAARESLDSQLWKILELIEKAVDGAQPFEPFFCHQGMPSNDGGHNFQPEFSDEGLPIGFPICAGWRAAVISAKKSGSGQEALAETRAASTKSVEQFG
jgi:hypothetical protein